MVWSWDFSPCLSRQEDAETNGACFFCMFSGGMLGSGMMCNLHLKVVDFVDLCSFMLSIGFLF